MLFISSFGQAQNMVPNGDFSTSTCPIALGQLNTATGWYSPTSNSPDHYHSCGGSYVNIGTNYPGYQLPYKGSGYAGFVATPWNPTNGSVYREYLECKLKAQLEKNAFYVYSMRVSVAEQYAHNITNKIGVDFTKNGNLNFSLPKFQPIYKEATLEFNQTVTDTTNWILLKDTFKTSDAFEFLTIGIFANSEDLTFSNISNEHTAYTYFYIDDIQLVKINRLIVEKDTQVCASYSDSILLQATSIYTTYSEYSWFDSSTNLLLHKSKDGTLKVKPKETTTYMVIADKDTAYATVTVLPLPEFKFLDLFNDTLICKGEEVLLQGKIEANGVRLWSNKYTLRWLPHPNLTVISDSTAFAKPVSDTYFYVTADDGKCSGNKDSILVAVQDNPITTISPNTQTICKGQETEVTATGGQTYLWNIGGNFGTETSNNKKSISSDTTTFVAVQAIDAPCRGEWDTSFIAVDTTEVIASFSVSAEEGFPTFVPTVLNTSIGGENYHWDFANGVTITETLAEDVARNRTHYPQYFIANTYQITLRAERNSGCVDSTSKSIIVYKKFILEIPNAFTPNNDGLNEAFNIVLSDGMTLEGSIYNRWGEKLYEWNTAKEQSSWNGTYKNKPVQAGVYVYLLKIRDQNNTVYFRKGTINLIR
ncbi:MAG: hypothetical protein COA58_12930 [Bacteroidetes bacterium]|nr:MAG: hypothetical protein COA58_12930 [Bacteroidota bacterium]